MIALDKVVAAMLTQALTIFRGNLAAYVPDLFETESAAKQAEITTWFGTASNTILVTPGWPLQPIQMPSLWVILGPAEELGPLKTLGIGQVGVPGYHALPLRESVQIIAGSPNQDYALWLQQLVLWALWTQRPTLTQAPYNCVEQRVAASPFAPMPNSAGDVVFPFARTWTLTVARNTGFVVPVPLAITATDLTMEVTVNGA